MSKVFMGVRTGINLGLLTSNPSDSENGDFYFNSTAGVFRQYIGGAWHDIIGNDLIQFMTNKQIGYTVANDSTSGTAATLASVTTGIVRLTNNSLVSVKDIPAGVSGQQVIVANTTGTTVTILDHDIPTIVASFPNDGLTNYVGAGGNTTQWIGQGFTPNATSNLASISVYMYRDVTFTGNLVARIYAADAGHLPTGPVLGSSDLFNIASVTTAITTPPNTSYSFNFSTPVALTGSTEYVIVFDASGTTGAGGYNFSSYSGATGPGRRLVSSNSGVSWTLQNDRDVVYTAYAITGVTLPNQIVTGTNKPIKLKDGGAISLYYDVTTARWRVFGGAGGGSGDTTDLVERLKDTLADSTFGLVTPVIVATQEDTLTNISDTTAVYDLVNSGYLFNTTGQKWSTLQLADSNESLNNTNALNFVGLSAFWLASFVDAAATYEVSRNGGNEWQTIAMSRIGNTDSFYGTHTFTDEATNQTLSSFATTTAAFDLNATTQQQIGETFTISSGNKWLVKNIVLQLAKTGSPNGNFYVQIVKDSSGNPSTTQGDVLAESNAVNITSLSAGNISVTVTMPYTYLTAGTYHIVIRTDAAYQASFNAGTTKIQWRGSSTASTPYAQIYNGTSWSTFTNNQVAYAMNGISIDLRARVTSSTSAVEIVGLGIFYELDNIGANTGIKNKEVFTFSGSSNTTAFTLTKFVPDPDLLKVYDVTTGQVYAYGAWTLAGQTVNFTSGQFYSPGNTLTLSFEQVVGNSFDNSDMNGLLLASNFLGSTDGTIDRSQNGRGIFLRRPDGTLREITIDNSDNIVVYSV